MYIKFLLFVVCLNVRLIYPDEYPYRDILKPPFTLPMNVRILQCSPTRTGSTLIFNVLQYLFEDSIEYCYETNKKIVIKSHNIRFLENDEHDVYYVITIRNPLNSLTSSLFLTERKSENNVIILDKNIIDRQIESIIKSYTDFYLGIQRIPKNRFIVLKYENFIDNFDYVYSSLDNLFNISIDSESKEKIKDYFNINSMSKLSSKYSNFDEHHPYVGIHGNHINNVDWKKNIPREFHVYLIDNLCTILQLFDYPYEYASY